MEYKKFGNTYAVRLDVGEEIMDSLKKFVVKEKITFAQINGLGGAASFTIGVRNPETKVYDPTDYEGRFEITSIHGNVTMLGDEPFLHIHMGAGNEKGEYRGGHLLKCIIGATAEIFVTVYDGVVGRQPVEDLGISVFKF